MRDFHDLQVWHKSHELTLAVYEATRNFPASELYGLTSQTRRASSSIPTNIAEGCGRGSDKELAQFLHIAMGSASELEYELLLVRDLSLLSTPDYERLNTLTVEVKKMLASFIRWLRSRPKR